MGVSNFPVQRGLAEGLGFELNMTQLTGLKVAQGLNFGEQAVGVEVSTPKVVSQHDARDDRVS